MKRRLFIFILAPFLLLISVLLTAEILLRADFYLFRTRAERSKIDYQKSVAMKIWGEWLSSDNQDPFRPPFLVFSNFGSEDPSRIQYIYDHTLLPPNQTWQSSDFIFPGDRGHEPKYTIHSNSQGFRGANFKIPKPASLTRIIVYGAYHTFGHGVEDEQSYPAQLESELNRQDPGHYQVLNEGRHAGTAIVGLAKLQHDLGALQPDIVIFDYGFVDALIWRDNFMPGAMDLPADRLGAWARVALSALIPVMKHSLLAFQFSKRLRISLNDPESVSAFVSVLEQARSLCRRQGIPFLLVRQLPVQFSKDIFYKVLGPTAPQHFVDVGTAFANSSPTADELAKFQSTSNWTTSLDPKILNDDTFKFAPYRLNLLQLSPFGNKVLAESLAKLILNLKKGA